jgi:hypothetical protein
MPRLGHAGGIFRAIHDALVACPIDWGGIDRAAYPAPLVARARAAWEYRVETEFRSIQVMTRFLGEVLGAGDPLEVYAGAAAAVADEIRHTALCAGMVEALGGAAALPEPLVEEERAELLALERALATAVSMLAVSEAVSTALIEDLRDRCRHPTVRAVLAATLADEDTHRDYGWAYVRASLGRFDAAERGADRRRGGARAAGLAGAGARRARPPRPRARGAAHRARGGPGGAAAAGRAGHRIAQLQRGSPASQASTTSR